MKKYNSGFSFVEVMIALVVVGVISMLVIPNLLDSSSTRLNTAAAEKSRLDISQAAMMIQTECPRWRCDNADPANQNRVAAMFAARLRNNGVVSYKIQIAATAGNPNTRIVMVDVDADGQTDLEYVLGADGSVSDYTTGGANCTLNDYKNNTKSNCTTFTAAGYTDGDNN